jgi:uncharacterized protein (TIGR00645 family)
MSGLPPDFEDRIHANVARVMFALRWIMVPFYVGLIGALLMLAIKFIQKLIATIPVLLTQSGEDTIFTVLTLIDMSLVANLVVIVMFAGWENFIGRLLGEGAKERLGWLASLDYGDLKLSLVATIMVIGGISVLESFVHIDQTPKQNILWELAILLAIGLTGVLLAVMDRLARKR